MSHLFADLSRRLRFYFDDIFILSTWQQQKRRADRTAGTDALDALSRMKEEKKSGAILRDALGTNAHPISNRPFFVSKKVQYFTPNKIKNVEMGWWWLKWNVGGAFAISQVSTHLGQWPEVSAIDGHLTQTVIYKMPILPWHGKYLVISAAVPPDPFTRYVLRSWNIWANRRQQTNTNWFKRFPILEMIMCTFKTTLSRRDETTNAHLPLFSFSF